MAIPRFIKVSCLFAILLLVALIFIPVPKATVSNTYSLSDNIVNVIEGTSSDIVFSLESHNQRPYINRGLEFGLSIEELNQKLKGQEVHLKFVNHWTPLDFTKSTPPIAYIELVDTGEIIFNNIKPS